MTDGASAARGAGLGPVGSFEHRRVVSTVRQRLFGSGALPQIGRYRIDGRLGVGGMGEVYLGYDEALDRKVAIKRVLGALTSEVGQARLRREARALARLSHPNVVQVYEIGEHEQCTFVAMEFVDGQTLASWLDAEPRSWSAVLDRFVAAGRGLAAVHEAGLVHRDFKPDNVLVSADGGVRVADFGLVFTGDDPRLEPASAELGQAGFNVRMSVTGAVLGTIRYMSREQLLGREVDARSDQFSFCVGLYEALWGVAPFSLASAVERLRALERGVPTPPPRTGARPPAWLWRVIRRGLSKDPAARWPDMHALLGALDEVGRRRRRWAWVGSGGVAVAVGVGALALTPEAELDPCAAVERELDGTWSDERRAAVERELADLDAEHVEGSRARIFEGLDRWSTRWVDERERVCRASAEQRIEPELARLEGACLTRQRQQVQALVELLLDPTLTVDGLANAVEAVADLAEPAACEGAPASLGLTPAPSAVADEVAALRRDIDQAQGLRLLDRIEEGLSLATTTQRRAQELGYGPAKAEALGELAKAEIAAGALERGVELAEDAIDEAELAHHDYLAAELWTLLTLRTLVGLDDADMGAVWLRRAEVADGRVASSPRARARLIFARGRLAELRGEPDAAEDGYRRALVELEGDQSAAIDRPVYRSNLARIVALRDTDEAIALLRAALVDAEQAFGPNHPRTAKLLFELGFALPRDSAESSELVERAARIWTQTRTRPSGDLATAEYRLGVLALERGELEAAEAHAHALASVHADSLPPGHHAHGESPQLLAKIYGIRGDHELALEQIRVALALWLPIHGETDERVIQLRGDAASNLLALGRVDEAATELDALVEYVPDRSTRLIPIRVDRCEVALRRGDLEAASAELDALDSPEPGKLGPYEFSFALLRALVDQRRGRLGHAVLERLRSARADAAPTDEQISAWLDQLEVSAAERSALGLD
ncbi:Serine/threonine-protein kinase PK-1 [Enhygromyxa salina]|uniref:Serine/threonine-protein kinase PK-1 n=1 Tax=Enhygromyxa salina TaxID=215803 RepID=A0A2S9YK75_9BACT|nr:serine/threonine-protein kinase [Enhygromyxa salina]PRQ05426.1 Serine/threonine-protein kinase PK-1 [Enhygromyxa salina]